jgi:hypothetical protein
MEKKTGEMPRSGQSRLSSDLEAETEMLVASDSANARESLSQHDFQLTWEFLRQTKRF